VRPPLWTYAGSQDVAAVQASGQTFSQTMAVAAVTTTVAAQAAVDWAPEVSSKDDDPGRTVPYIVEVQNRGNVDDAYNLAGLGAAWPTTVWNESFTQPLGQTALLAPGEVQRIGVRVQIPSSAASPDLDAVLLRATSTYEAGLWDDALLVTRVNRPAPGAYGVGITPAGQLGNAAPGYIVVYKFDVTNEGTQPDTLDLALQGAAWPSNVEATTGLLAPGASATVHVEVSIPAEVALGDWDGVILVAVSQADPSARDAAAAVTVAQSGPLPQYRIYLPLIAKGAP
jgi:uncharacterized membrane protein